jgi:hypothetical protein
MSIDLNAFTIREAHTSDNDALRRLAEHDSGRVPSGRILVGELDGELVAAVPMAGGPAIADPTRSTSALVSLLGLRAAQLRGLDGRRKARGPIRRMIPPICPLPRDGRAVRVFRGALVALCGGFRTSSCTTTWSDRTRNVRMPSVTHPSTRGGLVTFPRRFHQLGLQSLAVALALAAFVVAPTAASASTGPAMPPASSAQSASSCEAQWTAAYGTEPSGSCEEQALASRGTGAPSQSTAAVADAPRAEAPDSGFDWGSAAIGAAALAALLAAGTLVAMALDRRNRVRTAS